MDIAVFIMTRFNLNMKFTSHESSYLDQTWLDRRVELFEMWCQPSVANQSYKSFRWIVMLDPETPDEVVNQLNRLDCVDARRIENRQHDQLGKMVTELSGESEWVITCNLDSDDILHKDFVLDIVSSVRNDPPSEMTFLNFPWGYSFYKGKFYRQRWNYNQFRALFERTSECKTIYQRNNDLIEGYAPIRYIHRMPRWAAGVHGGNVANQRVGLRDLSVKRSDWGLQGRDQPAGVRDYLDLVRTIIRESIRFVAKKMRGMRW